MTNVELMTRMRHLDHIERNHVEEQKVRQVLRKLPMNAVAIILKEFVPDYRINEWLQKIYDNR